MKSLIKLACAAALLAFVGSTRAALAEFGARGTPYTRCTDAPAEQSIAVDAAGNHTPFFDEICKYPASNEAGVSENRCSDAQTVKCEGRTPTLTNSRDVPNGGTFWFAYPGNAGIPTVKCRCGCFVGSTALLTNFGWAPIERVQLNARRLQIAVNLPEIGKAALSQVRPEDAFIKGPELVPVLELVTANGTAITLTTKHPVLVLEHGEKKMIQAQALEVGDTLVTVDGHPVEVTSITPVSLPDDDNLVYNVDAGADGASGVIAANGLRVGDLRWQLRLSERESREANLLDQ